MEKRKPSPSIIKKLELLYPSDTKQSIDILFLAANNDDKVLFMEVLNMLMNRAKHSGERGHQLGSDPGPTLRNVLELLEKEGHDLRPYELPQLRQ